MSAANNLQVQLNEAKRKLRQSNQQISDLQDQRDELNNKYMFVLAQKEEYQKKLEGARERVLNVDKLVEVQVKQALVEKENYMKEVSEENLRLETQVRELQHENQQHLERERDLVARITELNKQLSFDGQFGDKREQSLYNQMREDRDRKAQRISEQVAQINELQRAFQNLKAENRQLRKLHDLPENFLSEAELDRIKANEMEKVEDYKKLVRALQEDNLMLEDERARLKYIIKSLRMNLPHSELIQGLDQEQTDQINQLIIEMKAGSKEVAVPVTMYNLKKENEKLKNQLDILNQKGQEVMKAQLELLFKDKGMFDESNPALQKLCGDSEEMKRLLLEALQKGFATSGTSQVPIAYGSGRFVPPVPHPTFDGEIGEGKSYKFDTKLKVVDQTGKPPLGDVSRHDVASLQLHLQETLELIRRKDYSLENHHIEISALYKRAQDYLITQDLLYQDYVRGEREREKQVKDKEEALRSSQHEVYELKKRIEIAEDAQKALHYDPATMEAKVIELSKMNAIHEVNILRLTRKCQTLEDSEKMVRQAFDNYDRDMQEKDIHIQNRIYQLKKFQARATHELKQLHARLRKMVPLVDYQNRGADLDLFKHKNAALASKCAELQVKVSTLSTQVRKNMEAVQKVREMEEIQEQTEHELQTIRARLSQRDPQFRWETAIFNKVVETLKKCKVSPAAAFQEFDADGNGTLSREEFHKALGMLRITDLSQKELDGLMRQVDSDGDGNIRYKEFLAKLQRHGVRNQTSEEQIIYLLMEGLKKSSQINSLSDFFELMDKKNSGFVSQEDFLALFEALGLKISQDKIDQFMNLFWKGEQASIDYQQFLRIFQKYQVQLDREGNAGKRRAQVTEKAVREKKRVFDKIYKSLQEHGKEVKHLFAAADKDGSRTIDFDELRFVLIEGMKLDITSGDVQSIFDLADIDRSGQISLPEFQVDFENTIKFPVEELIAQEMRGRNPGYRGEQKQSRNVEAYESMVGGGHDDFNSHETQIEDLKLKLKQRELREKMANEKLAHYQEQIFYSNQEKVKLQQQFESTFDQNKNLRMEHQSMKEELVKLQKDCNLRMTKARADDLMQANDSLQTELVTTRAAMNSYKGLTETLADQAKGLKLMIERHKDENENLLTAMRELQAQSFDQQKIGKLYYVVMLSRWQEAASNKKYTQILTEIKSLRKELLDQEAVNQTGEVRLNNVEKALQTKSMAYEKLKMEIGSKCCKYLPVEKALEFTQIITTISDDKHELEEVYFRMHTDYNQMHQSLDQAQIEATEARELLDALKREKPSELSTRLISMSDKLKDLRLAELKSKRESAEIKEKHSYLSKRLRARNAEVIDLEQKAAEYESKMHRREEEFRDLDNQRMARFFNRFENKFDVGNADAGSKLPGRGGPNDDIPAYAQHESVGESLQKGSGTAAKAEINVLEKKLARMEDQLRKMQDEVKARDRQLAMFQQWQNLETSFPGQDGNFTGFKANEAQMAKQQALKEEQDREMAEAAYATIKNLNDRLDDKKRLLDEKDEQLVKIRQDFQTQRNEDALKISELERKLGGLTGQKFSQLHTNAASNFANEGYGEFGAKYDEMTVRELKKQLAENDQLLAQLRIQISDAERDKESQQNKANQLQKDIRALNERKEYELEQARREGNMQILEQEKKKQAAKDKKIQQLTAAIQGFDDKLVSLRQKVTEKDDQVKTIDTNKGTEINAQRAKVEELTRKLNTTMTALRTKNKELEELRGQMADDSKAREAVEQQKKLAQILAETRAQLANETTQKERAQTMLQDYERQHKIGSDVQTGHASYFELNQQNQRLQEQVAILECQKRTVVVYNREKGTFEYIGEPILLSSEEELKDVTAILDAMKKWLDQNPRLTVGTIFEQADEHGFGELTQAQVERCLGMIGIRMRVGEMRILCEAMDPRGIGQHQYRPLLRELAGIPQVQFTHPVALKLAKAASHRDLNTEQFKKLIDPQTRTSLNSHDLADGLAQLNSDTFQTSRDEATQLFKYITKSNDPVGLTVSVQKVAEIVGVAQTALMFETIRDGANKAAVTLAELFSKHDTNRDSFLENNQIEPLLQELRVFINPNAIERLKGILDPKGQGKVNFGTINKYFSGDSIGSSIAVSSEKRAAQKPGDVQVSIVKMAARKVLSHVQDLGGKLDAKDTLGDGVLSRDEAQTFLEESKVPDLSVPEMQAMLNYVDSTHKGFISPRVFAEKMVSLATETPADVELRRFARQVDRGINLQQELAKLDSLGRGTLERKQFTRALQALSLGLTESQIKLLWEAAEAGEVLEIKPFVAKVKQTRNIKPPTLKPQQKNDTMGATNNKKKEETGFGKKVGAFENWELEKKYKVKLEALKQQIEEGKQEVRAAEKQTKHWQETANRVEREKNELTARLVDANSKPPKASAQEAKSQKQLDEIMELKDQLFQAQNQNEKLQKSIQVKFKAEIGQLSQEKDKLEDEKRRWQQESNSYRNKLEALIGKPRDMIAQREDAALYEENRVAELESKLKEQEQKEKDLENMIFELEQQNLELKFQKETFDLQTGRLQKRISDLEHYKEYSGKLSAVLKREREEEQAKIAEHERMTMDAAVAKGDSVKLRSKPAKSVRELELLVESLKRVIEKQKVENEQLKQQIEKQARGTEKLGNQKALRQKMEELELKVRDYEARDVNMHEKTTTVRKLTQANQGLREDLIERDEQIEHLQAKYKDLLVKFNMLSKESLRNKEILFSQQTGANLGNYENFLEEDEQELRRAKEQKQKRKPQESYDNAFDDVC